MEFYLSGKQTWKNLVMFECSQKGEYVLLPHSSFYEIFILSCSKFRVEIRTLAGRKKPAFPCSVSGPHVCGSGSVCTTSLKENYFLD